MLYAEQEEEDGGGVERNTLFISVFLLGSCTFLRSHKNRFTLKVGLKRFGKEGLKV